jgi:rhamnosyltransferase
MLKALRPLAERLIFVSTAGLGEAQVNGVRPLVDQVRQIPNDGFDVEMYRSTLKETPASDYDELVIVNSSTLGPVGDLGALMNRMSEDPCDFWGMTDGTEMGWNLQGYFLVYKQRVCASSAFTEFWENAVPLQDKQQIIQRYEHGLTAHMCAAGFKAGCVVSVHDLNMAGLNVTYWAPDRLLSRGMPLVKIGMLREGDMALALRVRKQMSDAGYDVKLLDEAVPRLTASPTPARTFGRGGSGRHHRSRR